MAQLISQSKKDIFLNNFVFCVHKHNVGSNHTLITSLARSSTIIVTRLYFLINFNAILN